MWAARAHGTVITVFHVSADTIPDVPRASPHLRIARRVALRRRMDHSATGMGARDLGHSHKIERPSLRSAGRNRRTGEIGGYQIDFGKHMGNPFTAGSDGNHPGPAGGRGH